MLSSNHERLVTQVLSGEVWPPLGERNAYRVDADGRPFFLPGMGGVTLGAHCGDRATDYASDHLEPGLSVRHRDQRANSALQFLACVGNTVTIRSGPAAGATGRVLGQHAYVLVDMLEHELEEVTTGDHVVLAARGQGLRLLDHPDIVVKNLDPTLCEAMPWETRTDGRLRIPVTSTVPPEAVGAGAGMVSEFANTDLMGAYPGQSSDLNLGLDSLRIGDVVALQDQDHRFGRGFREGFVTIGVISTGHCRLFGHGPGPTSLLSGPATAFDVVRDGEANLSTYFKSLKVQA